MYYSHDAYNLIPVFIPASKAYYGFFDINSGKEDEKVQEKAYNRQRGYPKVWR